MKLTGGVGLAFWYLSFSLLSGFAQSGINSTTAANLVITAGPAFDPPLQITHGGTYSGNWRSLDPDVPAVRITTSDPVIIENCQIRSAGNGIEGYNVHANITVRNCTGQALNPNVAGRQPGKFVVVSNFSTLIVERNKITGFSISGYGVNYPPTGPTSPGDLATFAESINGQTVLFRYNVVHNVEGRFSNGNGGFSVGNFSERTSGTAGAFTLYFVRNANIEIAWNEVVNEPFISQPEDVIGIPESRGLSSTPINIHDNFIQGDNPANAATYETFSGCGIQIGDSPSKTDVGYVHVHDNQVVNFSSCGLSISSGHNIEIDHNRSVSARVLQDGTPLNNSWRIPLQLHDYYWDPDYVLQTVADPFWHDNSMHDNAYGAVLRNGTFATNVFDHLNTTVTQSNNIDATGHLATTADEQMEYSSWKQKLIANGVTVGPSPPHTDFNGDGKSDLVWRNTDGSSAIWLMNGLSAISGAGLLGPGTGWSVKQIGDFNGDGRSDVLWQHTDGSTAIWLMDGLSLVGGGGILGPGTGWSVTTIGDFNGDGNSDILWHHTDGSAAIWLMDGLSVIAGGGLLGPGSPWRVVQFGDFNGDGKSDIVWQQTDGSAAIWLMNGVSALSGGGLIGPGTGWSVEQVGDFNGDGKSDIMWQNTDGSAAIWLMNGVGALSGGGLIGPGTGWSVKQVGDFNGDGKSDVVWQNTDGSAAIWLMNGVSALSGGGLIGPGADWSVKRLGDYNGDGRSDIVWQNADGSSSIWLMNGTGAISGSGLLGPGTGWSPAP